mmetsp:Transcript_36112/g.82273  ORF Transcript_36112/g.82273 Transcript_36112/m.82273 type:complete len:257 (-) Transcript_36112:146-916(-)
MAEHRPWHRPSQVSSATRSTTTPSLPTPSTLVAFISIALKVIGTLTGPTKLVQDQDCAPDSLSFAACGVILESVVPFSLTPATKMLKDAESNSSVDTRKEVSRPGFSISQKIPESKVRRATEVRVWLATPICPHHSADISPSGPHNPESPKANPTRFPMKMTDLKSTVTCEARDWQTTSSSRLHTMIVPLNPTANMRWLCTKSTAVRFSEVPSTSSGTNFLPPFREYSTVARSPTTTISRADSIATARRVTFVPDT